MTTIRDVAERAQVSVGTVSRVINRHPSVSPVVRQAVLTAIDELHYQPNAIARTLRTARTRTIGLLVPNMRNAEVAGSALQGVEAVAQERGYALFVGDARRDAAVEERSLRSMLERRVDGLLCNPTVPPATLCELLKRSGTPAVVYGQPASLPPLPTVLLSFEAAIAEAIADLARLGHTRVGTITHASEIVLDPRVGWGPNFIQRALQDEGLDPSGRFDRVTPSLDECADTVQSLLATEPRPTALFITPLYLVPATLAGVRAAGLHVPDDISLIGLGDSDWARAIDPPLSVIAADLQAHMQAATHLLIDLIERQAEPSPAAAHRATYTRRGSVASSSL